ncbi:MAG: hypothetical protein HY601_02825 [Candidatus Omnitrophica bacterium]|nr:hypothetical protein [Candidatus Omnitrophota bacterium]
MGNDTQSLMLLGRLYDSVPQFMRPFEFREARSVDELKAASHLVYEEFLKRNYTRANATQLKLSLCHALPTTTTLIALYRNQTVVGTVTIVEDSPLGLPMDEVYKAELDALRRQGHRLAEATMLALDSHLFGRKVFTMFNPKKLLLTLRLFRTMFDYLRSATATQTLVACFNPKHQVLFDFLQLRPLGGLKTYSGANGHPTVARALNIAETERAAAAHPAYRFFYGRPSGARTFAKRVVLSPEALRSLFVLQTPILASASATELAFIKQCYPGYDFGRILGGAAPVAAAPPPIGSAPA